MANVEADLVERLSEAESVFDLRDWETRDGYYLATCRITAEDVSGLIDLARRWNDWDQRDDYLDAHEWLPVTAWRALADLRAGEAVVPLLDLLSDMDEFDDWAGDDLPLVFGKIGKPAMEPLTTAANNKAMPEAARSLAASGLRYVAQNFPETRDRVVTCLMEMLAGAEPDHIDFNTTLLTELVDLQAVEAAELIERAFANDLLDVGMIGDWEMVRKTLGVEGMNLKMPETPHNSIQQLRDDLGLGVFSKRPVFWRGEADEKAVEDYFQQASDTFSKSTEAQQVIDRFGTVGWYLTLLGYALREWGETVDAMTLGTVHAFVFDYAPRKITVEPKKAAAIIGELALFWKYMDRVYQVPAAKAIAEWLSEDDLAARLEEELADKTNYGMAKSMFMAGIDAGYDMRSEAGMAEFMLVYNRAILANRTQASAAPRLPRTVDNTADNTVQRRIGRNEPCPCGSGKKFKKCCGSRH